MSGRCVTRAHHPSCSRVGTAGERRSWADGFCAVVPSSCCGGAVRARVRLVHLGRCASSCRGAARRRPPRPRAAWLGRHRRHDGAAAVVPAATRLRSGRLGSWTQRGVRSPRHSRSRHAARFPQRRRTGELDRVEPWRSPCCRVGTPPTRRRSIDHHARQPARRSVRSADGGFGDVRLQPE